MDIVCPNCAAAYRVPDSLLAGGKPLRCAACGHEWVPGAPPPAEVSRPPASPAPAEPAAEAMPPPAAIPPEAAAERSPFVRHDARPPVSEGAARRDRALTLSWLASLAVVAAALAAMAVYRHEIAAAWPPFERIVALLGG